MSKKLYRILSFITFSLGTLINGTSMALQIADNNPNSTLILFALVGTILSILCCITIPMWFDDLVFLSKDEMDRKREEYSKLIIKYQEFLRKRNGK